MTRRRGGRSSRTRVVEVLAKEFGDEAVECRVPREQPVFDLEDWRCRLREAWEELLAQPSPKAEAALEAVAAESPQPAWFQIRLWEKRETGGFLAAPGEHGIPGVDFTRGRSSAEFAADIAKGDEDA